ncbi:protein SDA1, putative [Plasmodium vivax]|nr:protein SDA1, putative [Plasmodium vivax]
MEAKLKRKKFLNNLQHNICRNYRLYQHDFYEQFDRFLFNYGVVLLNPFRKNDLFCSQLSFLSYTVRFFSEEAGRGGDEEVERRSEDGEVERNSSDGEASLGGDDEATLGTEDDPAEEALRRVDLEAKRKEIWDTVKSKAEAEGGDAAKRRREAEIKRLREENPLLPYEDLNEYINLLMVRDKDGVNFAEELFFLVSQLLVKSKHSLYVTVLLSILKTLRQIRRKINLLNYLQVLVFLSDVNLSKVKQFLFKSVVEAIVQVHRAPRRGSTGVGRNGAGPSSSQRSAVGPPSSQRSLAGFSSSLRAAPRNAPKLGEQILLLLHEAYVENSQRKRIQRKYAGSVGSDPKGDSPTKRYHLLGVPTTESVNNFACSVLMELIKKNIYVNKRNVNFLCEGIFYKNEKIVKCICLGLLGKLNNKEFVIRMAKEKINANKQVEDLKNISNQTHQKMTKAKIKKLHLKKEKILSSLHRSNNKGSSSTDDDLPDSNQGRRSDHLLSHNSNYLFIDLLFDPLSFANNVFNLICTKYRSSHGTVKLLLLNILCRIHQRNQIVEENLFLYYESLLRNLKSKTILPKYLSTFIQCLHGSTPSLYVQRVVHLLIKKFLLDNLSEEFIYLIINTIIEIIAKCPDCLDEEVFECIIVFRDYKNKNIASLIRRFVNLCKDVNPGVLDRKFLDRKTALLMQRRKLCSEAGRAPDAGSLLRYSYLLEAAGGEQQDEEEEEEENEEEEEIEDGEEEENGEEIEDGEEEENGEEIEDGEEEEEAEEGEENEEGAEEEEEIEEDSEEEGDKDSEKDCEAESERRSGTEEGQEDAPADRPTAHPLDKQAKKARRRDAKVKEEQRILRANEQILSEKILTDEDFRKLKRMRDYITNNKKVLLTDLQDICNAQYSEEDSGSSADEGTEKIITHEDLLLKRKIKKQELMKVKMKMKKNSQSDNRFKTNKEKEKRKSVMMLAQKLRRKKKNNAAVQYGKIKKKLKGKLAARAKKRGILQKRIAKKLSRRRR